VLFFFFFLEDLIKLLLSFNATYLKCFRALAWLLVHTLSLMLVWVKSFEFGLQNVRIYVLPHFLSSYILMVALDAAKCKVNM